MAWIYNKITKVMTECRNADVIKICKMDSMNYIVSDEKETIDTEKESVETTETKEVKVPLSKMKVDNLRSLAAELGIEDIEGLTADELRKVIKDVQGK